MIIKCFVVFLLLKCTNCIGEDCENKKMCS